MTEIPQGGLKRSAQIAAVPVAHIGRRVAGAGRRLAGTDADVVLADAQLKTAQQIFATLGRLKGGAMKLGQAMSIFEAVLPEDLAGPYREALSKLQDSAPPLEWPVIESQLESSLGVDWRSRFTSFDHEPIAAASIGQVHRAVWHDGRHVAVKVQYPGVAPAIMSDFRQISRMARLFGAAFPGIDMKSLMAEFKLRIGEEVDYLHEARAQRAFAVAFDADVDYVVPHVVAASPQVLVTEWVTGTPLLDIITTGTRDERNRWGQLYLRFLLSGPSRAGRLHADPHPGNFRITPDGRLAVLDYGSTAELPDGLPPAMGRLLTIALRGDHEKVLEGLRAEGFVRAGVRLDPQSLLDYLTPFTEPTRHTTFRHSRDWLASTFAATADPRNPDWATGLKLNLPPEYVLIHRAWIGSIGVLCQLDSEFSARDEFLRWVPGFEASAIV